MKISTTISKLGDKIPSFNLPPIITCRADAPCKYGCYAVKGRWNYENVKKSLIENLNEYKNDSNKLFQEIINYINNGDVIYKFFRWFSSGDIVDTKFFLGMIKVAKICKATKFLCFTKKFSIVNSYLALNKKLPNNLKIVFSGWDEDFKIDNPFNLPTTYVYWKNRSNKHIPEYAIHCVGDCRTCKACWGLKKRQSVYFDKH